MNLVNMGIAATLKASSISSIHKVLMDYESGTNVVYMGLAIPGTSSKDAKWQIKRMSYDDNSNVTSIMFAEGSLDFSYRWSNRTAYSYT